MSNEEFSNEFDTLVQGYSFPIQFGKENVLIFDEYEKSIFLTKAQEDLIISLYNGKNSSGDSFEKNEETRRYLSNLVKQDIITEQEENKIGLSNNSVFYKLPEDLMFIIYEQIKLDESEICLKDKDVIIIPITHDEYWRISRNPFRKQNSRKALRLDTDDNFVELIFDYKIKSYLIRYISKPSPIILEDLPDNLSINNISNKTECKLNIALHERILNNAVQMAITSKLSNLNNQTNK